VTKITDEVPLRCARGVDHIAFCHQSAKTSSIAEGLEVDRIVSSDWSHSGQYVGCGNPRRASRSAVQHPSRQASQANNFTVGGTHDFLFSLQELETSTPSKRVLWQDLEEYWLSVVHCQYILFGSVES
jgi:hypothetical protein